MPIEKPTVTGVVWRANPWAHSWAHVVGVIVGIAAALALRVHRAEEESLWYDETVSVRHLEAATLGEFLQSERQLDPPMMPVYFMLQYAWAHWVCDSVYSLRMMSVLAWMLALLISYLFARRAFGATAGLFTVCSLAISVPHIMYAQEIRMYSVMTLLAVLSVYAFYEAVNGSAGWWWWANTIANSILVWTHLFGVFVVVAEGCFLLVCGLRRKGLLMRWTLGQAPALIGMAYWVGGVNFTMHAPRIIDVSLSTPGIDFDALHVAASWMEEPGWLEISRLGYWFPRPAATAWLGPNGLWVYLVGAGVVYALLLAWGTQLLRRSGLQEEDQADGAGGFSQSRAYVLLALWFLLPPTGLVILSYTFQACFLYRYVLHSTVALHILIGGALQCLKRPRWRVAATVVLFGLYLFHVVRLDRPLRPNYSKAAAVITAAARPNDQVFMMPAADVLTLRYYARKMSDSQMCGVEDEKELLLRGVNTAREGRGAWLLLCPVSHDRHADIESGLAKEGLGFTKTYLKALQPVYLYRIRPPREMCVPVKASHLSG